MHKSKNIVHINTKAKRSQTSCLQEMWPFYSLTSVKDGNIDIFIILFWGIFVKLYLFSVSTIHKKKFAYRGRLR